MSIFTRRNALIGWIVLKIGKRTAMAKAMLPGARTGGAVVGGLAALGSALLFWRKQRGGSAE
jgi:hypothetical protein